MNERNKSQPHSGVQNEAGQQSQESRESGRQPGAGKQEGVGSAGQRKTGIGSSQGQDKGAREQGHSGTADIERGSAHDQQDTAGSRDSMVNDPTGAFKERP